MWFKKLLNTQKKFLITMGIKERAEFYQETKLLQKKLTFFTDLKDIDEKQMGTLFKVMLLKNKKNNFKLGF